jgi:PadR family transcriptional regulator
MHATRRPRRRAATPFNEPALDESNRSSPGKDDTAPLIRLDLIGRRRVALAACLFYCVEQMPRGDLLGSLEHLVLLALVRLGANAYGMTVRREIEDRTGRSLSIGAIYATLERLETKGLIDSSVGEPTAERGGRAKRHFRITADGELALTASQEAIRRMTAGLRRRWSTT